MPVPPDPDEQAAPAEQADLDEQAALDEKPAPRTPAAPDVAAVGADDLAAYRATRRRATSDAFSASSPSSPARRVVQDAAVVEFLDVADSVARRFIGRYQDGDDIRQVAYLGLVKAAQRFDPEKGDDFVSFAVPTISGEIKRHLRDHGWVIRPPRHVQELRGRAATAGPRLAQTLGRSPSDRELAHHLGVSAAELAEARLSQDGLTPTSLDATISEAEGLTLADAIGDRDARMDHVDLASDIASAVATLAPRERFIVRLRFFEDRTQQQIAAELGVTQMQVSRLLVKILSRLRLALTGPDAADATSAAIADASAGRVDPISA